MLDKPGNHNLESEHDKTHDFAAEIRLWPTVFSFCYLNYTRVTEVVAPLDDMIYVMCQEKILLTTFGIII